MKLFKHKKKGPEKVGASIEHRWLEFNDVIHAVTSSSISAELSPDELPLDAFNQSASRDEFWDYVQSVDRRQGYLLEHLDQIIKAFSEDMEDERMWATKDLLAGSRLMDYRHIALALKDFRTLIMLNHYALERYEDVHMPVVYAPPDVLIDDPE